MITGAILGRFQIFHNGHLRYLLESVKKSDHLIIGITNPDPLRTGTTSNAVHRSQVSANPLSYYDRMKMLQEVCKEINLLPEKYDIVPVPIDYPEFIKYYLPKNCKIFLTIHDQWSLEKKSRLESQGYTVDVVIDEYGKSKLSSSTIREIIASGDDYSDFVPKSVKDYLSNNMLEEVIASAYKEYCYKTQKTTEPV